MKTKDLMKRVTAHGTRLWVVALLAMISVNAWANTIYLPGGSSTYTRGTWQSAGAPSSYKAASTEENINIGNNQYLPITFYNAGDYGTGYQTTGWLQLKGSNKIDKGYISLHVTSTAAITVTVSYCCTEDATLQLGNSIYTFSNGKGSDPSAPSAFSTITKTGTSDLELTITAGTSVAYIGTITLSSTGTITAYASCTERSITMANFSKDYGVADFTPTHTVSAGSGTKTWTSSNTSVATIVSNKVHIVGAGITTIGLTVAGDGTCCETTKSCTMTVNAVAPTVTNFTATCTNNTISISNTNASSVSDKGGANITRYGYIYSTTKSTTSELVFGASGVTDANVGTDNINLNTKFAAKSITGLTGGTTYYVRAYAYNGTVRGYSSIVTITTKCAVTYVANNGGAGGSTTDASSPYAKNSNVTVLENGFTAPAGKTFHHWNGSDGNSYYPGNTINSLATDITLTAYWADVTYTDYQFSCAELTLTAVPGNDVILITSTAGQWVRSHDSIHVVGSGLTPSTDITFTTGDADKFVVKDYKYNNISTNESGVVDTYVYVFYKPASNATTDGIESFSTLGASVGGAKPRSYSLTSHTFVGRHIPTNVVIAAKMGKGWYALPANMTTTGVFAPELIAVDNTTNPTIAYSANSNVYNLYGNGYTTLNTSGTDGYLKKGPSGDQVKFGMPNNATTANAALWANNTAEGGTETHIGKNGDTDARNQIGANYWWNVALKSGISSISSVADIVYNVKNNQKGRTLKLLASAEGGPKWGLYAAGTGVEDIRLLSVEEINPLNLTVMEWGTNEIAVKYSGGGTTVTNAEVAGTEVTATLSNIGGDIQRISGLTDLNLHPGEELLIEITEGETPKQIILTIPYIVTSSTTVIALRNQTGETSQEAKNAVTRTIDLIIRGGGGYVNATSEEGNTNPGAFKDIYIYPGGKLELSANNLTAKNVFLRGGFSWLSGKGGESSYLHPQLLVASDKSITGINATGCGVFYDLYLTGDQWYLMALPKDVALSAVRDEAGNTPVTSGGSQNIWIATYSGQGRTQSPRQPGWTDIGGDALSTFTFERGKGYEIAADPVNGERPLSILRFPLQVASAWSNDADEEVIVNSWGILRYNAGTLTANHVGWNFVGNPFYSAYQTSGTGIVAWGLKEHLDPVTEKWTGAYDWDEENMDNLKYYTIPNKTDYGYDDSRAASTKLDAFFPFYVQVKLANENNAVLSFSASTDRTLKAPAVKESEAKAREVIVDFVITNNENRPCLSGLNISDRYSAEFDMDDKEISISNGVNELKVYTLVGDMRTAFNSLPESAISTIPLGYKTTTNGIHTIALSESCNLKALKSAVLIDHEENNLEWDLLQGGYDFETAAQANGNDTRFTMKIELMPEEVVVTTDINEGGVFEKMFAIGYETKVVLHGVPIGADVWAYSMSGKLIGSWQEVKSNLWTIDVPAKGVYNIRVSVKGEAQTLRAVVQ